MKKKWTRILLALLCCGLLASCGGAGTSEGPEPEVVLDFGHIQNPGHALAVAPEELESIQVLETVSEGRTLWKAEA